MNIIKLNSQLYFADKKLIFWTKFYLLLDPAFQVEFRKEYKLLESEFHRNFELGVSLEFDFDKFLNNTNIKVFSNIVENIINTESLTNNEILKNIFDCELLKRYDKKKSGRLFSTNMLDKDNLKEHFIFLNTALKKYSFYDLNDIKADRVVGEWISTKETGQLRINYNMTDFTPIGNQIRLSIQKQGEVFFTFNCLAKAHDYMFDKVQDIRVFETLVRIENGYIHHYRKDDLVFIYKRPIYNFGNNAFTTQTYDIEFAFEKLNNI